MYKVYKKGFNKEDAQAFYDIYCPTDVNVGGAVSVVRENYILDKINDYWNNGYSIFCVYGSGHAIRQELVLKDLVK